MIFQRICTALKPATQYFMQKRNLRPLVKVTKNKYRIKIDLHDFTKDNIRVKASSDYFTVEGKQEKKFKDGMIIRQMVRKFKLPEGIDPNAITSTISEDGILTITAPRLRVIRAAPCEMLIPIKCVEPERNKLIEEDKASDEKLDDRKNDSEKK